jgi:hypothetical protein
MVKLTHVGSSFFFCSPCEEGCVIQLVIAIATGNLIFGQLCYYPKREIERSKSPHSK